ncbi:MAG: hypothetical protein WKF90_10565 [Pyrinomonadaceae bacterium]|jgi:hypothetical protein|nr:hypothetical protein [Acidobacteriota bacterium]
MEIAAEIRENLGEEWIPNIYQNKVRTQRTRAHRLEITERENRVIIQHTLLGVELKVGNNRFSCPDLSTARYLQIFARLGCSNVAVPYDITKISTLADELESSWHRTLLFFDKMIEEKTSSVRGRMRSSLIREIRQEIDKIGAGSLMPEFKQSTKQRTT